MKNKIQKRLALLLVMALFICILPAVGVNAEPGDTSTQTDVYEISNAQEMKQFATLVNNGNSFSGMTVKLTDNITFDGVTVDNYTPICGFCGTFDGCGYSISGILLSNARHVGASKYAGASEYAGGVFGSIGSSAVVKNLTVKNSTFDLYDCDYAGAVVGYADEDSLITNCHTYNVTVGSGESGYARYVGGIVGDTYGTVKNCTVIGGSVTAANRAGGIAGTGSYIYNCGNSASVNVTTGTKEGYAGGVAGSVYTMQNCYNTGTVTLAEGDYDTYCGGVAGYTGNVVNNCYYLENSSEVGVAYAEHASSTIKAVTDAYMRSSEFVNQLNLNRGDNSDWLVWELRSDSLYPLPKKPVNISTLSVALASGSIVYDGTEKQPAVSIADGSTLLQPNKDYTVVYENNTNAGTATVYVYGENDYCGTATMSFTIEKATPAFSYKKSYTKTYGEASFDLGVSVLDGESSELTYKSSAPKTVSVSNGYVSIQKTGVATITVETPETDNYKAGKITIEVKVRPGNTKVSLSSTGKKLNIKWNKIAEASGYEIQYSTSSSFKNVKTVKITSQKTTSKTINKGLKKGKKYYVRVRSYKSANVDGKATKIYSKWSAKKSITIKK